MSKDLFFAVLLIAIVITGLVVAGSFPCGLGQASSDVGGLISQDTTWTPSGSPYTLANDTLVNQGVTLTIQPGVTVNLGSHSIEVNGTLTAQGATNSPIKFNSGAISFTSYCNGYNKQTGLGCSIENSILNATTLLCDNTTKINQCIITASVKGEFGIISFSNIMGEVSGDVVSTSTIKGDVSATTILNNNITGNVRQFASAQNNNVTGTVNIAGNCILSNNFIQGNITISSGTSTVSSNTISSMDNAINLDPTSSTGYIETTIKNNKITASQVGIDMESDITPVFYGWSSRATILLNTISGCSTAGIFVNSEDNQATNTYSSGNKATIMENIISNNTYGIQANPPSLIQGNLIINNQYGVLGGIITDNTIINNSYGVLGTNCTYNNIQNNTQYNFALGEFGIYSLTENADATNNWWGTNDTQAINQTIYDSKNDSTLGNVTYEPFLASLNLAAPTQDYTIAAGSTLTSLPAPSPSPAPPSPTPTRTTANPEYIAAIILAIIIALGILAFLLLRRKRQHERF
jgi:hypothetical protein